MDVWKTKYFPFGSLRLIFREWFLEVETYDKHWKLRVFCLQNIAMLSDKISRNQLIRLMVLKSGDHQLICKRSHYLRGFIHPRWLFGISSINSMEKYSLRELTSVFNLLYNSGRICFFSRNSMFHFLKYVTNG